MAGARFNLVFVVQAGRLAAEAVLLMASLAATNPARGFRILAAEPEGGPLWPEDPGLADPDIRAFLEGNGAGILRFPCRHFGAAYPHGNKIEALLALPEGEPFLFLDTDTLVTGPLDAVPFDFARPSASLRREPTWPVPRPGGPDRAAIWRALYAQAGIDPAAAEDRRFPEGDWQRFPYYNAGFFYGACPRRFGRLFLERALAIRDAPPPELAGQPLDPWLDQAALPLVIHALGGGPEALEPGWLDGRTTLHWRRLPLLYARESDAAVAFLEAIARPNRVKKLIRHRPFRRMLYQGLGASVRALFPGGAAGLDEASVRRRIRAAGLWIV
jgi:hypothetical protein